MSASITFIDPAELLLQPGVKKSPFAKWGNQAGSLKRNRRTRRKAVETNSASSFRKAYDRRARLPAAGLGSGHGCHDGFLHRVVPSSAE